MAKVTVVGDYLHQPFDEFAVRRVALAKHVMYGNGVILLNANCTGGQIIQIGGNVPIRDSSGGAVTIVGDEGNYTTDLALQLINYVRGRKILEKVGSIWYLVVFDHTDDITEILRKVLKDKNGNNIGDLVAAELAMELKSSV